MRFFKEYSHLYAMNCKGDVKDYWWDNGLEWVCLPNFPADDLKLETIWHCLSDAAQVSLAMDAHKDIWIAPKEEAPKEEESPL